MRVHKGQIDCPWSVTAVILRVPHVAEGVSPSGCRGRSTVYMTLSRIRTRSWKHGIMLWGDDNTRIFWVYWMTTFALVGHRVHLNACALLCANVLWYEPGYSLISRCVRLDCVYSSTLSRLRAMFGMDVALLVDENACQFSCTVHTNLPHSGVKLAKNAVLKDSAALLCHLDNVIMSAGIITVDEYFLRSDLLK